MVKLLHSVPKGEMVAIYMLAHQVLVAHDFTDDPEQAIQAVKEVVSVRYLRIMEPLQLDEAFREAHGARINTGIVSIDEQMQQLEQIAYHLSRVAGRKRLIWVTAGFPLLSSVQVYPGGSPQITGATPSGGLRAGAPPPAPPMLTSTTSALDQVARAMNHADVAVYAVDTRGLVVGSSGVTTGGRSSVPHAPTGQDSMVHLADRTGGTVVKGTNDVATALTKVLEDAGVVYTLGFYPDEKSLDRKFHDLRVHVKRPGVEVNHRKAYFASEPQPPSEEEVQAKIRDFSISPFDAPGIGLAVQVAPGKKADAVQMSVGFELSDVALEHQNDRWKGAADLVIVEQAKDGHALTLVSETFNFDMTEEAYRARLRNGVSLAKEIPMLPGLYQLRVLVADRRTGRIGSLRVFPPKPD
jgi:VWFA-related protein